MLIRVKAAGVNPIDNYVAAGIYPQTPLFPFTAGCDGAGLVEAVGNNVTKFRVRPRFMSLRYTSMILLKRSNFQLR